MKKLKRFHEGVKYENKEISQEEFEGTKFVEMKESTISHLERFVSKWDTESYKTRLRDNPVCGIFILWYDRVKGDEIHLTIFELEDNWFFLRVEEFDLVHKYWLDDKYFKCDEIGGLKEKIEEIFKNVKVVDNEKSN